MIVSNFIHHQTFSKYKSLLEDSPHTKLSFPAKSTLPLYWTGTTERIVYYVNKGMLSLYISHESGKDKLVGFWGIGGMYPLIVSQHHSYLDEVTSIIARRNVEVYAYHINDIYNLFSSNPELWEIAISYYSFPRNDLFLRLPYTLLAVTYHPSQILLQVYTSLYFFQNIGIQFFFIYLIAFHTIGKLAHTNSGSSF